MNIIFFGGVPMTMYDDRAVDSNDLPATADDFRKSLESSNICCKSNINFL